MYGSKSLFLPIEGYLLVCSLALSHEPLISCMQEGLEAAGQATPLLLLQHHSGISNAAPADAAILAFPATGQAPHLCLLLVNET